jgi:acyl phosphate:glycerol-3-phosphate acyltransferase
MIENLLSGPGLAAILFGYLLGSIPFGLLLTRAAGLGDVRKIGSGNIGATNVLRTGNKGLAAATLVLDALKATAAVLIVRAVLKGILPPDTGVPLGPILINNIAVISAMAGVAAFIGHIFPVWLGFKGGKGVATFIGAAFGIFPLAAALFCGLWLVVAAAMRYSSLAALVASVLVAALPFFLGDYKLGVLLALMTALIFYKHEANIRRLMAGTEPKIGQKT